MAYGKTDSMTNKTLPTHVGNYGDHPVGGAVGAAVGGLAGGAAVAGAVKGAAIGAAAGGPIGIAAGAGIGGVVGALAGKGIAQKINPTTEDAYWSNNYKDRDYVEAGASYDTYQPAYRHGVESYSKYEGRSFDDIEAQAQNDWENSAHSSTLSWDRARPASRDAYERLYKQADVITGDVITDEDINTETGE